MIVYKNESKREVKMRIVFSLDDFENDDVGKGKFIIGGFGERSEEGTEIFFGYIDLR